MKKIQPKHLSQLQRVFAMVQYAEANRKDVMPTRQELESVGLNKGELKELDRMGLIKAEIIRIRENGLICGRTVHYMTPEGVNALVDAGIITRTGESSEISVQARNHLTEKAKDEDIQGIRDMFVAANEDPVAAIVTGVTADEVRPSTPVESDHSPVV